MDLLTGSNDLLLALYFEQADYISDMISYVPYEHLNMAILEVKFSRLMYS